MIAARTWPSCINSDHAAPSAAAAAPPSCAYARYMRATSSSSTASRRSRYPPGHWQPQQRMRPEPPTAAPLIPIAVPEIVPPALADYAELRV